ncbi:MAG: hypothetical protein M0P12_11245 [Paludibacteraceae bacterium]|nr:hypothetical protein [Paludibacteraceae bacterium]
MKIIFSRKGFDSQNGKIPNPILPDGTMLSLPIPSEGDENCYESLKYGDLTYFQIIKQLNSRYDFKVKYCHLDPDLREDAKVRMKGWTPTFGQMVQSLSHLHNQGVGKGDIFLFFGRFRRTMLTNGVLQYDKKSPIVHVIYGYLQIEKEYDVKNDILPGWLKDHPHASYTETLNSICWIQADNATSFKSKFVNCLNFCKGVIYPNLFLGLEFKMF